MAVDQSWTDPSTSGALDLATGDGVTEGIWDKILSNLKALGGTDGLTKTGGFTNLTLSDPTINAGGGTLVLPQGLTLAPTAEGSIGWDTDDNLLKVGNGATTQTIVDTVSTQTLTNKTLTSPVITAAAFVAGDKYLVVDASGNIHVSAVGPAS